MEREGDGLRCMHCDALHWPEEIPGGLACPACGVASHLVSVWMWERWDGERGFEWYTGDEDQYGYCPPDMEEPGGKTPGNVAFIEEFTRRTGGRR